MWNAILAILYVLFMILVLLENISSRRIRKTLKSSGFSESDLRFTIDLSYTLESLIKRNANDELVSASRSYLARRKIRVRIALMILLAAVGTSLFRIVQT
jgi:TRAP-type C4-dicarboxylate transport system permease large subunit